jgi:tripartite-type tricarboxylate transporter receptor subunit TctC
LKSDFQLMNWRNNEMSRLFYISWSLVGAVAIATLAWANAIAADDYPTRPVRMIVAFAPGGSADINARIVGQKLGSELGGSLVIENKGGAGGNLGAVEAKKSAPDGYSIFYATSAVALAPSVYANPGFQAEKDFEPISLTTTIPLVLVVGKSVPTSTPAEFVTWLKQQEGKVNYASSGRGALLHLAGALFLKETGTKATHIAYRGSAPAITDMLGGSVQFMFLPINEISSHLESGSLKAIAVTHTQRVAQLPNVPTMREAFGLTTMDIGAWQGLLVPAGTPKDITAKLSAALERTLKAPEVKNRLVELGSIVLGGTSKEYAEYMRAEAARWATIVSETGAKAE